eukprot:gene17952-23580_t
MSTFIGKTRDSLVEVDNQGRFVRTAAGFRHQISKDDVAFQPESGRYHLYISLACPWANRCLAVRNLKGLQSTIDVSVVHPTWQRTRPLDDNDTHAGWVFAPGQELSNTNGYGKLLPKKSVDIDPINGVKSIRDLYELSGDTLKKYSVPVLWDKKTNQIVNNESSEIIRLFTVVFDEFASGPLAKYNFYPEELRKEIDEINSWVYDDINNGVYKCGFAKSQLAYDEAVEVLFNALDKVEDILSSHRYLVGNTLTEVDIRLFMTLVRFDEVYAVYFKCNVRSISSYPNIINYCRDIYQIEGMKESIDMEHIKIHYYTSHAVLNHYAVIPKGPNVLADLALPHDRNRF